MTKSVIPEKVVDIHLKGDFRIQHPEFETPLFCKGFEIHYEGSEHKAQLENNVHFHARSLRQVQALYGPLPRDQHLLLTMKPEVLRQWNADYLLAEDEDAFLQVGEGACLLLEHYVLEMP